MESRFRIKTDVECRVSRNGIEECIARPDNNEQIHLQEGLHLLSFESTANPKNAYSIICEVMDNYTDDYIEVHLLPDNQDPTEHKILSKEEISRRRGIGVNMMFLMGGLTETEKSLRLFYFDGEDPYDYSTKDFCQEYILRSRLEKQRSYETDNFTIRSWNSVNDMLNGIVHYSDAYGIPVPESRFSFSQKQWEEVNRDGKIDYYRLREMLRDNILIMKVLLTVMAIKESGCEYPITFMTLPDVGGHMDYYYDAKFDIEMTVESGIIKTNRLFYAGSSNTFQGFWPSFYDEQFILNTLEDRRHFLDYPLALLNDDDKIKKQIVELGKLAKS